MAYESNKGSWIRNVCRFSESRVEEIRNILDWNDPSPEETKRLISELEELTTVVSKDFKSESSKLILYHGFDDIDSIRKNGFVFDPRKSEQGVLWFSHIYQSFYDPEEYAKNKGDYVLVFPIDVTLFFYEEKLKDGSTRHTHPKEMNCDFTENCDILCLSNKCIKLPDNFLFSYKVEKFIISTEPIQASSDMIIKS